MDPELDRYLTRMRTYLATARADLTTLYIGLDQTYRDLATARAVLAESWHALARLSATPVQQIACSVRILIYTAKGGQAASRS